jgi:ribosomal protein L20
MARIKRGTTTRAKHKNILEQAKGYRGRRKNTIRIARQAVERPGNMPTVTARSKSGPSGASGFSASTPPSAWKA